MYGLNLRIKKKQDSIYKTIRKKIRKTEEKFGLMKMQQLSACRYVGEWWLGEGDPGL